MSTCWPATSFASSRSACSAVSPASGTAAASSNEAFAGFAATTCSLATARSASPPIRSFSSRANTASPGANRVTAAPTRSTTPATSQPSAIGGTSGSTSFTLPSRILKSSGFKLAARTATSTSRSPTAGSARSTIASTSGPPYLVATSALIHAWLDADQPISSAYVITRYITASTLPGLRYACGVSASNRIESPASRRWVSPRDVDLDRAGRDDEVLARAGRVRVGVLDAAARRGAARRTRRGVARRTGTARASEKLRSLLVRIFDSGERSTRAPDCVRALISAENVTSSARAIFHRTLIVGALWPSSIWPSIARDTPEIWARRSSERPRRVRRRRRLRADDRREVGRLATAVARCGGRSAEATAAVVGAEPCPRVATPR